MTMRKPRSRACRPLILKLHRLLMLGAACALTAAAQAQPDDGSAAIDFASSGPGAALASDQVPAFEALIARLRSSNDVIPWVPPQHPSAAAYNREAVIPPQCYTRTEGQHNPCYVCHQNPLAGRENKMNDGALQVDYSFSDLGMTNHYRNLFEDRSEAVAAIGDDAIRAWVAEDNYSALPGRLEDAGFEGWIPDLANLHLAHEAFDDEGFALDGSHWVAFNYKPLPSTFWPTNGSTDDVMIRLPAAFRSGDDGEYSHDIYRANLAIVEANVKGVDSISVNGIDEASVGRDLNGDGRETIIDRITEVGSFVGAAAPEFLDTYLYPEGTEFLHTVRYLGFGPDDAIVPSTRMKEVRYMRKWVAYRKSVYERNYRLESYDKDAGNLPGFPNLGDNGLDNEFGWSVSGFIEDRNGELRVQTYEENLFCMGCHSSIGATIDKTFSFARKVDGADGWGYIDLRGMPDAPNVGEIVGEIETYLDRVGGGGEFRSNPEMFERWFTADGTVDRTRVRAARDVYELITPSVERALELNKAYRVIVDDQDYIYGRDATVRPPANVYDAIDNDDSPTLPADRFFEWDIRLDWSETSSSRISHPTYTPDP